LQLIKNKLGLKPIQSMSQKNVNYCAVSNEYGSQFDVYDIEDRDT